MRHLVTLRLFRLYYLRDLLHTSHRLRITTMAEELPWCNNQSNWRSNGNLLKSIEMIL